jgi:hypothetical protein
MTGSAVTARRNAAVIESRPPDAALSLESEQILRRHHERRILRLTTCVGFPDKVAATAISYFKRFFLDRSVLDYNPAIIALSSLYASFKVEEVLMSADDLVARSDTILNGIDAQDSTATESLCGTAMRVTAEALLTTELSFLHLLSFHLICYHPYRSLSVLYARLAADESLPQLVADTKDESAITSGAEAQAPVGLLDELFHLANRTVTRRTLLTDTQFTHSPAAIAIAAVVSAAHELHKTRPDVNPTAVRATLMSGLESSAVTVLEELIGDVRCMREGGEADDVVKNLEVQRRALCNLDNDPTSEVYKERERKKVEELDDKRMRKAQADKEKMRQRTEELMGFGGGSTSGVVRSGGLEYGVVRKRMRGPELEKAAQL